MSQTTLESFQKNCDGMVWSGKARVDLAYLVAKFCHRHDVRKELTPEGVPVRYFEHPRRVALLVLDYYGPRVPDLVVVALLHDVLEDSQFPVTKAHIRSWFGEHIATAVDSLTKRADKDPYKFAATNEYGVIVKVLDRLDNLLHMDDCPESFKQKQVQDTKLNFLPILRTRPVSTSHQEGFEGSVKALESLVRELDEKLNPRPDVDALAQQLRLMAQTSGLQSACDTVEQTIALLRMGQAPDAS